jgi:photosystem II stability/assembly factor-like uncharacterized protein
MIKQIFFGVFFLFSGSLFCQIYGELNIPAKCNEMPNWAKLMYDEPINFIQLAKEYRSYYKEKPFEKNQYTRYYKRLIMNYRTAMDESGNAIPIDIEKREKEYRKSATSRTQMPVWMPYEMETFFLEKNSQACPWQVNVYAIDVAKSNPNILYCISETEGLFKTVDKGKNWTQIGIQHINASEAIAIHPKNPDTVYLGTNGIIRRSTDGGNTWTSVFALNGLWVYDLDIPESSAHIILAATNKGLYRSANSGQSWTQVFAEASSELKVLNVKNNIVISTRYNSLTKQYYPVKSINFGMTFSDKKSGWYTSGDGGVRMAITTADPKRIYAIALTSDKGPYLMRSIDEGETWSTMAKGSYTGYDSPDFPLDNWQGYYDLSIVASQKNADEVITGTGTMVKSIDGGKTFKALGGYGGSFPLHPDFQASVAFGDDSWIATDGGLTYSTDFFTNTANAEARNKGINGSDFWGFDAGWHENVFVGGRYHNGNTVYHENYRSKFLRMGGAESPTGYVNPIKNRDVYFSDIGAYTLPFAYDTVLKYGSLPCGLYPNESYYATEHSDMVWSPICYHEVYLGRENKFYKSENNAASFEQTFALPSAESNVEAIEVSRSNPDVIYFTERSNSPSYGNIWRSADRGKTFVKIQNPSIPDGQRRLQVIALSPTDDNFLYVAYRSGSSANKVFYTKDGGKTWANITTPTIGNSSISDIMFQYGTNGGLYIACDGGNVFYRNQDQNDWTVYNTGIPVNHFTRNLRPFYRDGKLINGGSNGVWEIPFIEPSKPIAQPTVDKLNSFCSRDTFYFEDYSVLQLDSVTTYTWTFPGATYVSDIHARNPKVVYKNLGSYDVTLQVTNLLGSDSKTEKGMINIGISECEKDTVAGKMFDLTARGNNGTIAKIPGLKNATEFTCMTWIKINSPQDCFTQIISNWNSNAEFGFGFAFQGYVSTRNLTFSWKDVPYWLTTPFNLDTNKWIHVAMVVYPDSVRLYANGEPWTYKGNFKNFDLSSTSWVIGNGVPGQCGDFNGQMDELKMYNRALTRDEIRLNMHLISKEKENGLVAYYQFNENDDQLFYDKIETSHMENGNGAHPISSAPVATGVSQKLNSLNQGKNIFDQTGVALFAKTKPSTSNFEIATYRLNSIPIPLPDIVGQKYNDQQFIVRSWGIINSKIIDSFSLLNAVKFTTKEEQNPTLFGLHYRKDPSDYLPNWQTERKGLSANSRTSEISFAGATDYTGNYFLSFPEIVITNVKEQSTNEAFLILPNPAKDEVNLVFKNLTDGLLLCTDITGKVHISKQIVNAQQFKLDVKDLPIGVYNLRIGSLIQKLEIVR